LYLCPANYHVLIEEGRTFALSVEPLVNFARPSIDVLFESAAVTYGSGLVGVLLSGASADGAAGLGAIKARGGTVFCQAPESAMEPVMPRAGCAATRVDRVASPEVLGLELSELCP
jgi:two-component system chemotaxis response regulator CheB